MDDILTSSVTDPRGERQLHEVAGQDLAALSVEDLKTRIAILRGAIERAEQEMSERGGAVSAAEALFRK
ncbi:DUF1192 domain-containing protein [Aquisalinus flavus]|uniref:DUF1192 domain-containing protein n=1 Tax=Aquisalinus flavus TaxID=1526572 RepID=A0A8J2V1E7_9PROT|nr:DUF1192 domain-containing protein [Aquisalinus flavus]MBD0426988.1 DUF1192 domain-containing protein [Aquisalinus flavus]UNE46821.1 DUF1192 domain-containing protein [Aquisalinus flavus]GGC97488.1 hypothetical protein GCM10011342_03010 [Aquisalinus flavus]